MQNTTSARFVQSLGYIPIGLTQANELGFDIYRKTIESQKDRNARMIKEMFDQALNL
ncbi:MAG: hypothetical protein AABX47_09345 [Nanoarchaeota archaeon]